MCASSQRGAWQRPAALLLALLTCLALLVPASAAWGQQPSREQEQLRRLRLQVQKLQQDQTAQQEAAQRASAESAGAKAQLDAAQTERDGTRAELRRARAALASQTKNTEVAQKDLEAARQENTALQTQLAQLQTRLQTSGRSVETLRTSGSDLQRQLAALDASHASLTQRHVVQAQGLQTCSANNLALRSIGEELIQRYAKKGMAEVLAHNEPVLQIQRVAMENMLQGYQDKLDQQALRAAPAASAGNPSTSREPARVP